VSKLPETELCILVISTNMYEASAVKVTHLPTGLTEVCGDSRSILRNKNEAVRRLADKLEHR
jgi:protein subunit release factor A